MASQVGICNIALNKLGAGLIISLDDTLKSATTMKAVYDATLDAVLADHPWQVAIERVQIPASSTAPSFGWAKAYPLPADFLKLVQVGRDWCFYNPQWPAFTLEGNAILTDSGSPLPVSYIKRITAAGLLPAMLVQAFATKLASECCEALTQSLQKKEALIQEYERIIKRAKRSNDIQLPPQPLPPNSWEMSLYGAEG